MFAAERGLNNFVQILLNHNAEINTVDNDGCTALMRAAKENRRETIDLLLEHWADYSIHSRDGKYASEFGSQEIIDYTKRRIFQISTARELRLRTLEQQMQAMQQQLLSLQQQLQNMQQQHQHQQEEEEENENENEKDID